MTTMAPRFTVEERAARFQRRYTGPWQTIDRQIGPIVITTRQRRRTRIEYVELAVAMHDLQRVIERDLLVPILRMLARIPMP